MKQLFGGILIAVGILIAGVSGLCSLAVLFGNGEMTGFSMLPLVLVIGGLPIVLGVLIAVGGRSLIRRAREENRDTDNLSDIFD
jgi:hypothetical protein